MSAHLLSQILKVLENIERMMQEDRKEREAVNSRILMKIESGADAAKIANSIRKRL